MEDEPKCKFYFDEKGRLVALSGFCKKKDLQAQFDKIKELLNSDK